MTFARRYIIAFPIWALLGAISYAVVGLLGLPSELAAALLIVTASAVCGLLSVRGYLR